MAVKFPWEFNLKRKGGVGILRGIGDVVADTNSVPADEEHPDPYADIDELEDFIFAFGDFGDR